MCASYGLDGSGQIIPLRGGLEPMSELASEQLLAEWSAEWGGKANTSRTRKDNTTNLNPIIWQGNNGARHLDLGWWWLHVGGKPAKFSAFNSRDDALMSKWRTPFQHRAILPATWYNEGKKRWALPSGEVFGMAAIMSPRTVDGKAMISYSLVTRAGVGEAATVITERGDSRMPMVLPRELHDEWLDPGRPGDADLVAAVQTGSEEISRALTAA